MNTTRTTSQETTMTKRYKIWTGNGDILDGSLHSSRAAAVAALRAYRGWPRAYLAEHCAGGAWSVYGSRRDRDADEDGAYADTIKRVEGEA